MPDLANGLPLPWDEKAASAIEGLYSRAPGAAGAAGLRALEAAKLIAGKLPRSADGKFTPYLEQKEAYDKAGDVGRGLSDGCAAYQGRHGPDRGERRRGRMGYA